MDFFLLFFSLDLALYGYNYEGDKVTKIASVVNYNKSHTDVKIELIDYSDSNDPNGKLSADIAAGVKPDLYELSFGLGDISYGKCLEKGMFI